MSPETRELMTAEELERFDLPGKSTELVRGRLIVREPPGFYHGHVSARLLFVLGEYVYGRDLGWLSAQDTGFRIESDPDTVRAPDVAFTSNERRLEIPKRGYAPFAPDLAAEILSPDDRPGEVLSKVGDWLDAGVRIVWVIDPERREARIYRGDGTQSSVAPDGTLPGESVLPGFTCHLADLFD
ncbi:MAG: Uma2 family endonuclease [Gemmatimonadaceae bacterium]